MPDQTFKWAGEGHQQLLRLCRLGRRSLSRLVRIRTHLPWQLRAAAALGRILLRRLPRRTVVKLMPLPLLQIYQTRPRPVVEELFLHTQLPKLLQLPPARPVPPLAEIRTRGLLRMRR